MAALMPATAFHAFTLAHLVTVLGCVALIALAAGLGRQYQKSANLGAEARWRKMLGWLCLAIYFTYLGWLLLPQNFDWQESLPLQFCDMGMLVGAGALLTRARWLRGLLYFWLMVFTLQAFITPTLQKGAATPDFWLFWGAHAAIANAAIYDLVVGQFRPTLADALRSYVISFFYAALLLVVDNLTGWNYGFVGPLKPSTPTLVDALGDYPLRVVWMVLIAAAGFTLAWLPWARKKN
jgi:hypothetical integral membrane protein (TIGR02206 family)